MTRKNRKKPSKVTLLYDGECGIDEALERGYHLKEARNEILRKYDSKIKCQVGNSGYRFYGSGLRILLDGIYHLHANYVVNLEANEGQHETLRDATLEFISLVPEIPSKWFHGKFNKGLGKEIREFLLEKK